LPEGKYVDINEWLRPGIVAVLKPNVEPNGTGFFVTSDGYILTCYHVLQPALKSRSTIRIQSQEEIFDAELVEEFSRSDDELDFAVLKVQVDRKFPCLPLGTEAVQGHPWCSLGFELAERYYGVPIDGAIKGYTPHKNDLNLRDIILESYNPILGGLSGSPVFNTKTGRVVGVIKEEMVKTQGHATSIEAVFRIWPALERLNSQSDLLMHVPEQKKISDKIAIHIPYTRNANFTGRDTLLADLQAALQSGDKVALTHVKALTGLGGIGKTQLALEYSYRYQDDYNIVWWLRSELSSTLLDDYARLAVSLKLPGWDSGDLNLMAGAAKSFLETHPRWLLVFDNAQDPQDIKPYLPHGGGGHVIITSRNPNWGNLARSMTVSKFERSESVEFLCKRTGQEDRMAADELAEALGDLPLALEQAGAYMETMAKPLGEYLKAFQERKLVVLAKGKPSDYPETVATTWNISLEEVQEYPGAVEFLQLFSYLAPDDIPLTYLIKGSGHLPDSIASILKDEDRRDEALAALRRYSLIGISGDMISVHRLVQAVTRNNLALQKRKELAGSAIKLLNDLFPKDHLDNVQSWSECSVLLPHVLAAAGHGEELDVEPEAAGHLLNESGLYLLTRGEFAEARATLERALKIDEQVYGPDHPDVARDVNNLGLVLHDQGNLEDARKCYERALKINELVYGPDHPSVARDVNNLGSVLKDLGDLQEARKCYERGLKIDEQVYGPDHPNVAMRVNNLGMALKDLGDLEGARKYLERALKIDELAYGPDHPNIARDANNLGTVLSAQDDLEGAIKCFERAHKIDEQVYGPDHFNVAINANNIGMVLQAQGDLEGAKRYLKRALKIDEQVYGPDHPSVARDVNNIGGVLKDQGDLEGARECYKKALKIFQDRLGEDHPSTKTVRGNLESIPHAA
jgi:tetratricopeptide (TPR) repeat protein